MYVLEGPSESVGKTDKDPSPCNVQVQSLRWPASNRSHKHMPFHLSWGIKYSVLGGKERREERMKGREIKLDFYLAATW